MDAKELLERYKAGERDFTGISLRRINLQETNLSGINLKVAYMYDARLKNVNLSGANLSGIDMNSTIFEQVELNDANLTEADLCYTTIIDSSLKRVNLEGAMLAEAGMFTVDLEGANLKRVLLDEASFSNCNLRYAVVDVADDDSRWRCCYVKNTIMPGGTFLTNVMED